jgi:outer membrane protein OmpA-like peptidoglycan-associated protein
MTLPRRRIHAAVLVASLLAAAAAWGAKADSYDIGSLASQFLQSKTRMTVLDRDDKAASACREKHFVKADPAGAPVATVIKGITERKWQEVWTLTRCGANVYYMIFFTEEGSGGAFYAIVGPDTLDELEKYKNGQPAEPAAQNFLVYFDTNAFNVRVDAALTLQSVVDAAKRLGSANVVLTGHTDTMGSSAYNQKLSDERALSVKNYLARQGVSVANVVMVGMGKTDQRVTTPDQVREQENRNVHIEIK